MVGKTDSWSLMLVVDARRAVSAIRWATGAELVGYDFTTPMRVQLRSRRRPPSWDKEPCPHEAGRPR